VRHVENRDALTAEISRETVGHIAQSCGGDVRKALNCVELLFSSAKREDGRVRLTLEDTKTLSQKSAARYDRDGDEHFDLLSALMKSIRGSDPDAAIHYLARLLEAGDIIAPARRILCSACEDIALAYPQGIAIVKACVDAARELGLPEARLPLADAVILLATAPKSNTGISAIDAALADVRNGKTGAVPRHLQNVHADGAGFEREQGYLYSQVYDNNWVEQQYLPDELAGVKYYEYGGNRTEQAAKAYWDRIKGTE
jgi:putative ATPase